MNFPATGIKDKVPVIIDGSINTIKKYQTTIMGPVPRFNTQGKQFYTIVPKNPRNRSSIDKFIKRYTLNQNSGTLTTSSGQNLGGNFNMQNVNLLKKN